LRKVSEVVLDLDEFWGAAERGILQLPRCGTCERWWWYPLDVGPCCGTAYEWVEVPPTGTVYTATVVHRAFSPTSEATPPYSVGLVEPAEAIGVRLVSGLHEGVGIGSKVRLVGTQSTSIGGRVLQWAPA
jgi:uncharacterized protein